LTKSLRILEDFLVDNSMHVEVLANDTYQFPRTFKPKHVFLVKSNYHNVFVIALSKNSFWIQILDESYRSIIKNLIKKLKDGGLTYVH